MKNAKKLIAVLLVVLTAMAIPLAALAATSAGTNPFNMTAAQLGELEDFKLIIDNDKVDDKDVVLANMGTVPVGMDLFEADGVTPVGLRLDWDEFFTGEDNTTAQDITYILWRNKTEKNVTVSNEQLVIDEEHPIDKGTNKLSIYDPATPVKILNVYPCPEAEPLLKSWLTLAFDGTGKAYTDYFTVDTVLLGTQDTTDTTTFNGNPAGILMNSGKYKYDVIFFGTSDGNGNIEATTFYDLNATSYAATRAFVDSGYGVLFGHDTVCSADHLDAVAGDGDGFDYFTKFADDLGIRLLTGSAQEDIANEYANEVTTRVKVVNHGLLTSFPFSLDEDLVIPPTHSLFQRVGGDLPGTVWMELQDASAEAEQAYMESHNITGLETFTTRADRMDDGKYSAGADEKGRTLNGYLVSNNNLAMIQTGHYSLKGSTGDGTTVDEARVIANTLFYLKQKSLSDYSIDGDFVDTAVPVINKGDIEVDDGSFTDGDSPQLFDADITVSAEDFPSIYTYQVVADKNGDNVAKSNAVNAEALSEMKGYVFEINESATDKLTDSEIPRKADGRTIDVANDSNTSDDIFVAAGDGVDDALKAAKLNTRKHYFVHIRPVDNANNVGEEIVLEIYLPDIYEPVVTAEIDTDKDTYTRGEEITITSETKTDALEVEHAYATIVIKDSDGNVVLENFHDNENPDITDVTIGNGVDSAAINTSDKVDSQTDEQTYETANLPTKDFQPGVYTAEIVWKDADGKEIARDTEEFTVEPPKFDVTYVYKVENPDGTVSPKTDDPIEVTEGPNLPDAPSIKDPVRDDDFQYEFIGWFDDEGNEITDPEKYIVDKDVTIEARYNAIPLWDVTYVDRHGNVIKTEKVLDGATSTRPANPADEFVSPFTYVFKCWEDQHGKRYYAADPIVVHEDLTLTAIHYAKSNGTQPPVIDLDDPQDKPDVKPDPDKPEKDVELIRLGGETRIETALAISSYDWDKAKVVILATANQFPDAMAGVPLATALDAPILLTYNLPSLEASVRAEIDRLHPEKVYILGQTDAVNANIEAELRAAYVVERLGGKDRFGTAVEIAKEMEEIHGGKKPAKAYFVRSDLYADALSVSPVAAIEQNPILYVAPSGKLDEPTTNYAKTLGNRATIIGGYAAVNDIGEKNVRAIFSDVDRVFGNDRYQTSVKVCTTYDRLFTGDGIALATGKTFPDALTGGAFAARNKMPVLLVNGTITNDLAAYLHSHPTTKLFVFGGKLAVSDTIAYAALGYCVYPTEK